MRTIVLLIAVAFMFLGTGAAYGMGGGGHSGDGRTDYLQKPGANGGSASNAIFSAVPGNGEGNGNADGNGHHYGWDKDNGNGNGNSAAQQVPEPLTLFLLGSAVVGLAVFRKKVR